MAINNSDVVARECRFAIHVPKKHRDMEDLHVVKEQLHMKDGTIVPNLRMVKNFKRSVYVTKPNKRTYKQKKEWTEVENTNIKEVTQSDLRFAIASMLDKSWSKDHIKKLAQSPYLYGTDITSTSLLKKAYQNKYPNIDTPFSVATFDVETDVVNGTEEVIMCSLVFKRKIYLYVKQDFVFGISNVASLVEMCANKYIKEYLDEFQATIDVVIGTDVIDMLSKCFAKAHEIKPDFLAIWNMDYDIPKVLEMFEIKGVDPRDVLCDPSVPKDYRVCKYIQGPKKKVTASGKVMPISPALQWHTLELTASFYVIDAMCSYKHLRLGEQEESSYSLDAILFKHLGVRKLSFKEADQYEFLKWHQFMQKNYKIEYMVYNIFDSLSMIKLDIETKDLGFSLPSFSATTDFRDFKSQPKRIADALHFFALERGFVMGTVGSIDDKEEVEDDDGLTEDDLKNTEDDEEEEEEGEVLDAKGWILTLPAHMSVLGLPFIEEDPTMLTGIRAYVYDSDEVAAYPSATEAANVSKTTTKKELISIEGIDEDTFRMQNLNFLLGQSNALEYTNTMFKMPDPRELLSMMQQPT